MLDILAVSPHPDDVELCCGGLIAKMRSKGYRIGIVDLTKGELGTEGTRQYRPSVLIVPYGDGHHPDHAGSRKLADKAVFLAKLKKVQTGHDAHRVRIVAYYMLRKSFDPSFIVDVTESYEKKLEAIKAYKSQMGLMLGMEGLLKSIELRDQLYGSKIGVKYGEPFLCDTPLKIDDLVVFSK